MIDWFVSWLISFPCSFSQCTTLSTHGVPGPVLGAKDMGLAETITTITEFSDYWSPPGSLVQDILPASKELSGLQKSFLGKRPMSVGQSSLAFSWSSALPYRSRASIQGLVDWDSLKAWYFMPQLCLLGSHTTMATLRNMFLRTRLLFLPST